MLKSRWNKNKKFFFQTIIIIRQLIHGIAYVYILSPTRSLTNAHICMYRGIIREWKCFAVWYKTVSIHWYVHTNYDEKKCLKIKDDGCFFFSTKICYSNS